MVSAEEAPLSANAMTAHLLQLHRPLNPDETGKLVRLCFSIWRQLLVACSATWHPACDEPSSLRAAFVLARHPGQIDAALAVAAGKPSRAICRPRRPAR